ncbi:MAG: heavy metal translocating P-type ATPase [Bacteroidia bacterium]
MTGSHTSSEPLQTLNVEGMTCANCAMGIQRTLRKKGLPDALVNFPTGEVSFTPVEGYDHDAIVHDIEQLGYAVKMPQSAEKPRGMNKLEKLLLFCTIFTIPLLLHMVWKAPILMSPWFQLAMCIPVMASGGIYFLRSAILSIRSGVANMDVLIALGSFSALIYSLIGTFWMQAEAHHYLFFETAASIVTLILAGNVIEKRSLKQTGRALEELAALKSPIALRLKHPESLDSAEEIATENVKLGDFLLVREGARIPADGTVYSGNGLCDERMITGESLPVEVNKGQMLRGGTLLLKGNLVMKASRAGSETFITDIVRMVQKAQGEKAPMQKLSDRISEVFVPVVIGIALLTFGGSLLFGIDTSEALMRAIAVLVVSCPCAMGLAAPTAVMAGLGVAARKGILFKSAEAAQKLAETQIIVFDKTGTLTNGEHRVEQIVEYPHDLPEKPEAYVLALEQVSNHPLAETLRKAFLGNKVIPLTNIAETAGFGIEAYTPEGIHLKLGSKRIFDKEPEQSHDVYLSANGMLVLGINLKDELKSDVRQTMHQLKELGCRVVMLSGDRDSRCKTMAAEAGIEEVYSECLPADKTAIIEKLKRQGIVAMVGDGINDAPALATADIAVSVSLGSAVAKESAGLVLTTRHSISDLVFAIETARATLRTMKQNLFWAFFYNVLAIPIAAFGYLNPTIAAISMALSDVVVIGNAIRLNFFKGSMKKSTSSL